MDSEVSALNEADNANAKEVRSCRMGLSDIVLRADALDLKIDGFGNNIAQLFKDSAKMSAVQDIWHEIENLHKVDDDTTSELWSLRRRVTCRYVLPLTGCIRTPRVRLTSLRSWPSESMRFVLRMLSRLRTLKRGFWTSSMI